MNASALIPLALLLVLQISNGFTEETMDDTSSHDDTSNHESSLSRSKRGYKMRRPGRGLQMLRLGKRFGPLTTEDTDDDIYRNIEDFYAIPPEELLEYLYPEGPVLPEEIAHPRLRRSTPSSDGAVPSEVLQEVSKDLKDAETQIEDIVEYPYTFDDEAYLLGDLDELLQAQNDDGILDKRALSMLRMGKRQDEDINDVYNDDDKRGSMGMLRLGKRQNYMLRLGKRPATGMNMLRLGKRQRSMSMLRLGKRPAMSMLRLGKRGPGMSMLRLGKRGPGMSMLRLGKRGPAMSMLRLGRGSGMGMLRLGKRPGAMSMLRLGKRPGAMSMLRLGKRPKSMSMLRLGKRSVEATDSGDNVASDSKEH